MIEGSGSVLLTNGSGSTRPKNIYRSGSPTLVLTWLNVCRLPSHGDWCAVPGSAHLPGEVSGGLQDLRAWGAGQTRAQGPQGHPPQRGEGEQAVLTRYGMIASYRYRYHISTLLEATGTRTVCTVPIRLEGSWGNGMFCTRFYCGERNQWFSRKFVN